jgi:hypothetical protein
VSCSLRSGASFPMPSSCRIRQRETRKSCSMLVLRFTVVTVELMVELVKQSDMAASPKGEVEMEARQRNAI